ncbi:MAG TPA: glycosyltransferase family 4 protein [Verrucomicrobiae bacterium]|nr:glycosyltransferase family 4 protein [Verrucomicrobiae bacterium]
MKILYVSQYFPPEMGAPAARAAELAHHWAAMGHKVSVLTGFPNHPTGIVPEEWRPRLRRLVYYEKITTQPHTRSPLPDAGTIHVYRTWLWPLPNRKPHERMRNYASFFISAGLRGLTLPHPDVIIATSPQLLVALAGWWLAFARSIPFVFEVRDLWPESLTAVGVGHEDSLLHHALAAIAGFLYERSDRIVVVTSAFRDYLIEHWRVPAEKIAIVENGVETDLFAPQSEASNQFLRRKFGLEGKFLVCYIGTMGMAHGLDTLLESAAQLRNESPNTVFLLIGEGAEKARIQSLAKERDLSNVLFLDQQPRDAIPAFISASDACVVLLKKTEIFKTVIPTKMLEFMSCARPVILAVEGQAQEIIEQANGGIVIEPENASALSQVIHQLAGNKEFAAALGQKGREYVVEHFSRARTAEKYIDILQRI